LKESVVVAVAGRMMMRVMTKKEEEKYHYCESSLDKIAR